MRVEIVCCTDGIKAIPVNYQYYLTSAIYNYIRMADPIIAEKIHEEGFGEDNKAFKLFTYSYLKGDVFELSGTDLRINPGCFRWFVSSPINRILDLLVTGISMSGKLEIKKELFDIHKVKIHNNPSFKSKETFLCNSPIVVTKRRDDGTTEYVVDSTEDFSSRINNNLMRKYDILFGEKYSGTGIKAYTRKKYPSTKLIKFKTIKIRGIFDEIVLEGDTDLMHIAYDAGLGEKNSMGFGMIERRG